MTNIEPILEAVRKGATLCKVVQRDFLIRSDKDGQEPVTIGDYGTQAILCRALMQHFPNDSVISEESGTQFAALVAPEQKAQIIKLVSDVLGEAVDESMLITWLDHGKNVDSTRCWYVDPIDGTKGFLARRHYVNAIGLVDGERMLASVIGAPAYPNTSDGNLIYAVDDTVYLQSMNGGGKREIRVSDKADVRVMRALESVEKGHVGHARLARVREIVGMDEGLVEQADSAEKYARIATGDAELYMRLSRIGSTRPHKGWDHLPGAHLVLAGGGMVTGLDGEPLDFSQGANLNNKGIIASNGTIHGQIIDAVQQLLAEEQALETPE